MAALITRVFMNGNSQAVRIPQEFRLETQRVEISRTESGALLLTPLPSDRGAAFLHALEMFANPAGEEFVATLEADRRDQQPVQERDVL